MNQVTLSRRGTLTALVGDIRCTRVILSVIVLAISSGVHARAIQVVSGTYGQNCGAPWGNATLDLATQCDGRGTCSYVLNRTLTVDPAKNCPKDFLAEWRCSDTEFHTAALSPEAGAGSTLVLSCIEGTGAGR
ncbi:hypothetical protein EOS_17570 [Caballeronia mineralivorans PML1(12)]|uniref:Uncharacterized protein n=1 Tax=Caballeronia mineralivorans PML1(12) TaxID=908627 RepID=A0A0J1CWF1_9BURK|nr:hypothetical protein EOS_17570 [Caballeronia mineralivorans PML1(12)]